MAERHALGAEVTCGHADGSNPAEAVLCVSPHDGEQQGGLSEPQRLSRTLSQCGKRTEGLGRGERCY